jgi:glutamate formiminotransferase / 5-formyltetrahydrofolate cyclo-ligase
MTSPILLAVPNVSEGRDEHAIAAIGRAFADGVRLLDVHSDGDHHRTVFTLAGQPGDLADALLRGARKAVERIDVMTDSPTRDRSQGGQHPYVGAVDVAPVVYLYEGARGAACAEALVVADRIGEELGVPVFLYGELSGERPRAELRRGGVSGLAERMVTGECRPDFGPTRMHSTAGATLLAARPPLVAFNLELAAPATVKDARAIAGLIREGGAKGLPGVRAIGVALRGDALSGQTRDPTAVAQVSMNVERPAEMPLATVVEAVRKHAEVTRAELVGLAPRAAMEGFPEDVPLPGFDPARHVIENALGS